MDKGFDFFDLLDSFQKKNGMKIHFIQTFNIFQILVKALNIKREEVCIQLEN